MGNPTWRYHRGAFGKLEGKIFDSDDMPGEAEGWYDSPAKVPASAPKPKAKPKAKPKTRARKAPTDAS